MSVLLLKYAPKLALVLAIFGVGSWAGYKLAQPAYNRLQGQFSAYQVQMQKNEIAAQEAANKALQQQIEQRTTIEANNAQIIESLHSQVDSEATDLARANRLLELAARENHTRGGAVSQASDQPGTPPASGAGSDESLAQLLVAVRQECERNADRFDALQAQLRPQL